MGRRRSCRWRIEETRALTAREILLRLCAAGAIAEIARVGHAPLGEDDPLEVRFANGAVFSLDVGAMDASDLVVEEGAYLDRAFGHLRSEEPETFAAIARDWTRAPLELGWAIGASLSSPRRLIMTQPYSTDVGYVFACAGGELALFSVDDLIFATSLDDPEIATFGLQIGRAIA
jgi:hypothetical protein